MKRRINNKIIPPCMIGTWAWGKGMNGSRMVFGKSYSEEQLIRTFNKACSLGFTMWDTAEVYGMGKSEKVLGKCLKENSDVIISTKYLPDKKYKSNALTNSMNKSFERLEVNSIDLYWLHQPYALKENLVEMTECLKSGKIKGIGLSNCSLSEIKEAEKILGKSGFRLTAVQNHYSLLSVKRQEEIIIYCNENNIIFFGYMVLEQGALSGHYNEKNPFPICSMRGISFGKKKFKKIKPLLDYQKALAEKYNVDTSQIPIAWAISKGVVPIIGLTRPEYAISLSKGIEIKLSSDEIKKLELFAKDSKVICKGSWE